MRTENRLFILGDSYSTYEGWIPKDYASYYRADRTEGAMLNSVEETWWKIFMKNTASELVRNCSWSGTTICNTGYGGADCSKTSFICRFDKLAKEHFFENNHVDTVIVFGCTNDSWADAPLGEEIRDNQTQEQLFCVRPAIFYLARRISEVLPSARVIFLMNGDVVKPEINNTIIAACEEYGHEPVMLSGVSMDGGHPNIAGMKTIADILLSHFNR